MKRAIKAKASGRPSEAYDLYSDALKHHPELAEAWMGVGSCAGWMSDLVNDRFDEMKKAHHKGLSLIPSEQERKQRARDLGLEQFQVAEAYFNISFQGMMESDSLTQGQLEHADRICKIIELCEHAKDLNPDIPYAAFISEVAKRGLKIDALDAKTKEHLLGKEAFYVNALSSASGARAEEAREEGRGWISFIGFVLIVVVGIGIGRCVG